MSSQGFAEATRVPWHFDDEDGDVQGSGDDNQTDQQLLAKAFADFGPGETSGSTDEVGELFDYSLIARRCWTAACGRFAGDLIAFERGKSQRSRAEGETNEFGKDEVCPFCMEPALSTVGDESACGVLLKTCAHALCSRAECVDGRESWLEANRKCPLCTIVFKEQTGPLSMAVVSWETVRVSPAFQATCFRQLDWAAVGIFDEGSDAANSQPSTGLLWKAVGVPPYPDRVQRDLLLARDLEPSLALVSIVVQNSPCYYVCNLGEGYQVKIRLDFSKQRVITLGRDEATAPSDGAPNYVALDDQREAHVYSDSVQQVIRGGLQQQVAAVFDFPEDSILRRPFEEANVATGLSSVPVHGHVLHLRLMRQVPFHLDVTPESLLRIRKLEQSNG